MFGIVRIDIIKIITLLKIIYKLNTTAIKIPMTFFTGLGKTTSKVKINTKVPEQPK